MFTELTQQLLKKKPHVSLDKHDVLNMFRYALLQVTLLRLPLVKCYSSSDKLKFLLDHTMVSCKYWWNMIELLLIIGWSILQSQHYVWTKCKSWSCDPVMTSYDFTAGATTSLSDYNNCWQHFSKRVWLVFSSSWWYVVCRHVHCWVDVQREMNSYCCMPSLLRILFVLISYLINAHHLQ